MASTLLIGITSVPYLHHRGFYHENSNRRQLNPAQQILKMPLTIFSCYTPLNEIWLKDHRLKQRLHSRQILFIFCQAMCRYNKKRIRRCVFYNLKSLPAQSFLLFLDQFLNPFFSHGQHVIALLTGKWLIFSSTLDFNKFTCLSHHDIQVSLTV